jgi:hypothetical protein
MTRCVDVLNRRSGVRLVAGARWCETFLSRLRGLMFRRALAPGEALVLVEGVESRAATAIHMFFVPFPITVIWVNTAGRVVDKVLALPWRPFYGPRAPARYTLEAEPALLERIAIDDELDFADVAAGAGR